MANQVKTFHAGLLARKSCQVIILVKIIKIITIKAVVVGFILNVEAPIHNTRANTEIKAMKISLRVMEPNFLYSSFAHAAISGEPFTSGLQNTYVNNGVMINRIIPTGKNAKNHVPQLAATIPDLADNSRANGFGAAPVKKIELDTQVVANATQFK